MLHPKDWFLIPNLFHARNEETLDHFHSPKYTQRRQVHSSLDIRTMEDMTVYSGKYLEQNLTLQTKNELSLILLKLSFFTILSILTIFEHHICLKYTNHQKQFSSKETSTALHQTTGGCKSTFCNFIGHSQCIWSLLELY